jgi:regulator of cell morphogenesis and NO signaling
MASLGEQTVRDLASRNPAAARIFEKFGIDYCCGGERSLAQACSAAKVSIREVADALEAPPSPQREDRDWQNGSLAELAEYIVERHHRFARQEIQRLIPLFARVVGAHGQNHAELEQIQSSFQALAEELTLHLIKEERMLFPYIEQLESAVCCGGRLALPMFGTVQNPVRMMAMEHDSAGELLRRMRDLANGYALPPDACVSFKELYQALQEFEADLHQHIHLENNILFPRAVNLEAQCP